MKNIISGQHTNIESLKNLGFIFETVDNNTFSFQLPSDWKMEKIDPFMSFLIDSKNRKRGHFTADRFDGYIVMYTRYYISNSNPDHTYTVDTCTVICDRSAASFLIADSEMQAVDYLYEHFPDWNDPTKYWD